MDPRPVTPVPTQRGGDVSKPPSAAPTVDERIDMMADAVTVALDPDATAAMKRDALAKMREAQAKQPRRITR